MMAASNNHNFPSQIASCDHFTGGCFFAKTGMNRFLFCIHSIPPFPENNRRWTLHKAECHPPGLGGLLSSRQWISQSGAENNNPQSHEECLPRRICCPD